MGLDLLQIPVHLMDFQLLEFLCSFKSIIRALLLAQRITLRRILAPSRTLQVRRWKCVCGSVGRGEESGLSEANHSASLPFIHRCKQCEWIDDPDVADNIIKC